MPSFFSPKGRMHVSRPLAYTLNSLNMLAPVLMIIAVGMLAYAKFGELAFELRQLLIHSAAALIAASLVIRILWGMAIRHLKNSRKD
jgi:hypothetical protein